MSGQDVLRERIARAIHDNDHVRGLCDLGWGESHVNREAYRANADAVIAALGMEERYGAKDDDDVHGWELDVGAPGVAGAAGRAALHHPVGADRGGRVSIPFVGTEITNRGWRCPGCGRCYAPWVTMCASCPRTFPAIATSCHHSGIEEGE